MRTALCAMRHALFTFLPFTVHRSLFTCNILVYLKKK